MTVEIVVDKIALFRHQDPIGGLQEIDGNGYARVRPTEQPRPNVADAVTGGATLMADFGPAGGEWGSVVAVGLIDGMGHIVATMPLDPPRAVDAGDLVHVAMVMDGTFTVKLADDPVMTAPRGPAPDPAPLDKVFPDG